MKTILPHTLLIGLILSSISPAFSQEIHEPPKDVSRPRLTPPQINLKPLDILTGEEYTAPYWIAIQNRPQKMGLYDSAQVEILPIIYDGVFSGFMNPHYVVVAENGKQGLFNLEGKRIFESIYNGFLLSPSDSSVIGAYLGGRAGKMVYHQRLRRTHFCG